MQELLAHGRSDKDLEKAILGTAKIYSLWVLVWRQICHSGLIFITMHWVEHCPITLASMEGLCPVTQELAAALSLIIYHPHHYDNAYYDTRRYKTLLLPCSIFTLCAYCDRPDKTRKSIHRRICLLQMHQGTRETYVQLCC